MDRRTTVSVVQPSMEQSPELPTGQFGQRNAVAPRSRRMGFPAISQVPPAIAGAVNRVRSYSWTFIFFILIVVLPTGAALVYSLVTRTPFYQSEVQFSVHNRSGQKPSMGGGLSGIMGSLGMGGGFDNDPAIIKRYLQSPDALEALERKTGFRKRFESGDMVFGLSKNATADEALAYFRNTVTVKVSTLENVITMAVWGYSPSDARTMARSLLEACEEFVNQMAERERVDAVGLQEAEVKKAEERLLAIRLQMNAWRNSSASVDPKQQAELITALISSLEQELAKVRTDMREISASRNAASQQPRMDTLKAREASLLKGISDERKRLTGGGENTLSSQLVEYERLNSEADFAQKGYESALASLLQARIDNAQQHKYMVVISRPSLSVERIFPLPFFHTLVVLIASLIIYGIVVLLYTIMRDYRTA